MLHFDSSTWTFLGSVASAVALQFSACAQPIPAERPRSRPPSELTGWADWENAESLLKRIKIPPAPPLSPNEAMKTFRTGPGYRIELVAAEPMVQCPIFFEFDPEGRIWVVEYQGYMRDLLGTGEGDPICRLVVLEDLDEDGKADQSTVFLDKLVMPRSFAFVKGGVLLAEPPNLWFCEDKDGDLHCDSKRLAGSYGRAGNPQHTANGLRYGIDNWLHSADWPKRHRFKDGKLEEQPTVHRGQFGVTFDDYGRFMTCYESSALQADLIPAEYLLRNKHFYAAYQRGGGDRSGFGVNVNIAKAAQEIYPIRVTPAITLGALELRDDGRLRTYTIVSSSCFYNGDQFPEDAYGNVFVPEAGGHLIGRLKLSGDLEISASRYYPPEQEILASTDERFRPVNARVGPDGALYVADMYHGVIEHVIFMVPYLEKQIKERGLEQGLDMGRIYRLVHEGKPIRGGRPKLSTASNEELTKLLSHSNGWWRLTAQRLLIERKDPTLVPTLRRLTTSASNPLERLHALWTLDGLDSLDFGTIQDAARDSAPGVRAAAIRLCEKFSDTASAESVLNFLATAAQDAAADVRLQALLSLGGLHSPEARALMLRMTEKEDHPLFRSAALTGLEGAELEFLREVLLRPKTEAKLVTLLAEAMVAERDKDRMSALFDLAGGLIPTQPPLAAALVDAALGAVPQSKKSVAIPLAREPDFVRAWMRADDEKLRERAYRMVAAFTWPGARTVDETAVAALTQDQRRLFELGKQQFEAACASCHQPHGAGLANVAPPLAGSEWTTGPAERLVQIVLQGLYGPVQVSGIQWNLHMPGFGSALDDEQIAAVLTYVRRAWGNKGEPINASVVTRVREQAKGREMAWTAAELFNRAEAVPLIEAETNGEFRLPARKATTHGRELAYRPSLDILAPWRREQDVAEWPLQVEQSGEYEVWVQLAADDASAGDQFVIETEASKVVGVVLSSGGYDQFREILCGKLQLRRGPNRILMRPEGPLKKELADVRSVRLLPSK